MIALMTFFVVQLSELNKKFTLKFPMLNVCTHFSIKHCDYEYS